MSVAVPNTRRKPARSALESIHYASIADGHCSSTDDEGFDAEEDPEDTSSVIGVSMSRAQTHLKSHKTPAIEKAAAIEEQGGFFNDRLNDPVSTPQALTPDSEYERNPTEDGARITQNHGGEKSSVSPPPKLPSPWRAGPKTFARTDETSGILKNGLAEGRRRTSSGPDKPMKISSSNYFTTPSCFSGDEEPSRSKEQRKSGSWQDFPQFDGAAWGKESWNSLVARARGWSQSNEKSEGGEWSTTPTEEAPQHNISSREGKVVQEPPQPGKLLRRATSDQSLYITRTLSKAPSLGDDSRFEKVHEQVNSRGKAIRDSLQDSNFKLSNLSLPKAPDIFNLPKMNFFQSGDGSRGSSSWVKRSLLPSDGASRSASRTRSTSRARSVSNLVSSERSKANATSSKPTKVAGMSSANAAAHPSFTKALEKLTGDVVILGGYRGSILREAKAPHRRLWVPIKAGLNLRKVDLEVGFEPGDEERVTEKIVPGGMLTHIGPVDISKRLFKRLRASDHARDGALRIHDYGYDWRLSPHFLSNQLIQFLEGLECNAPDTPPEKRGAIVIAHSLGGLIIRHAVNQRPELFSGVVFAGVPDSCVNVLGPIRNGDDVLFSSKVLTAQVNFSIRTSFAFLPLEGRCFIDKDTKEEYPIDFFNVNDWIKYRLSPCTDPPLPSLPAPGRLNSIMGSMSSMIPDSLSSAMPSMPFMSNRRDSNVHRNNASEIKDAKDAATSHTKSDHAAAHAEGHFPSSGMAPQMGGSHTEDATSSKSGTSNPITGNVLSREKAIAYLTRILPEIKQFRHELAHSPTHQTSNAYPPLTVIYGKSTPTVYGAKVRGREGIARADCYDDLAFASGDGVVLARMAMLPEGYRAVRHGIVASERGHVTLLGDLEAVGQSLLALRRARRKGVGLGGQDHTKS